MLELTELVKTFTSTKALDGLSLFAKPGEILGIAGPNGAGKSTLIHILSGELAEDSGAVVVDGQLTQSTGRPDLVSIVHQELRLFPTLTVMENLLIGTEKAKFLRPKPSARVIQVAEEFGLMKFADTPIDACSLVVQQLTEIARAIIRNRRVVLLDEPNSALTAEESEQLFKEVIRLKEQNKTIIILVSHRLADLEKYCDRIYVVRDGKEAAELTGNFTTAEIGQAIVGGRSTESKNSRLQEAISMAAWRVNHSRSTKDSDTAILKLSEWNDASGSRFAGVNFSIMPGQSIVITGQEDGGGREILRTIAGTRKGSGVRTGLNADVPGEICYVPGSRGSSLFFNFSISANLATRFSRKEISRASGSLRASLVKKNSKEQIERFAIKTKSELAPVGSLSGGTQQKVALGSAFSAQPQLLILEDPTRGVDIKTRAEIVAFLREFVEEGNSLLCFSPEIDEVFELADQVFVASKGSLSEGFQMPAKFTLTELVRWVDKASHKVA